MKDKKKIYIILGTVLALIVAAVLLYFLVFKKEDKNAEVKPTECNNITGGSYNLVFKSESETLSTMSVCIACPPNSYENLLEPTKEGYVFEGWFYDESFEKAVTVSNTMDITPVTKKDKDDCVVGYEDITLYAKWAAKEDKTPTPTPSSKPDKTPTPSSTPDNKHTYKCEEGWTLNGTKCTKTYDASKKCPSGSYDVNGKCVEVIVSKKIADTLVCKNGEQIPGRNSCQGTRISSDSSGSCANAGGIWYPDSGECRTKYEESHTCPSNYVYLANPSQYNSNIHGEAACYPIVQYIYSCSNSQDKLEGTKCIATTDAKLQ